MVPSFSYCTFHIQDQLDPVLDPAPRAPRHAEVVLASVLPRLLAGLHVELGVEPAAVAVVGLGHEGVEVEEGGVLGVVVEEHVGAVLGGEVAHGHGLLFRGLVPRVEVVQAFSERRGGNYLRYATHFGLVPISYAKAKV